MSLSAGGHVAVKVDSVENGVRVAVKDTGLGIPQHHLPHIFDKYYQASTKATAGEKGTGLGLAIVRELVLLRQGQINVTSNVGRGTEFTIYFAGSAEPGQRAASSTSSQTSSSSRSSAAPN